MLIIAFLAFLLSVTIVHGADTWSAYMYASADCSGPASKLTFTYSTDSDPCTPAGKGCFGNEVYVQTSVPDAITSYSTIVYNYDSQCTTGDANDTYTGDCGTCVAGLLSQTIGPPYTSLNMNCNKNSGAGNAPMAVVVIAAMGVVSMMLTIM